MSLPTLEEFLALDNTEAVTITLKNGIKGLTRESQSLMKKNGLIGKDFSSENYEKLPFREGQKKSILDYLASLKKLEPTLAQPEKEKQKERSEPKSIEVDQLLKRGTEILQGASIEESNTAVKPFEISEIVHKRAPDNQVQPFEVGEIAREGSLSVNTKAKANPEKQSSKQLENQNPFEGIEGYEMWVPKQAAAYLEKCGFSEKTQKIFLEQGIFGKVIPQYTLKTLTALGVVDGEARMILELFGPHGNKRMSEPSRQEKRKPKRQRKERISLIDDNDDNDDNDDDDNDDNDEDEDEDDDENPCDESLSEFNQLPEGVRTHLQNLFDRNFPVEKFPSGRDISKSSKYPKMYTEMVSFLEKKRINFTNGLRKWLKGRKKNQMARSKLLVQKPAAFAPVFETPKAMNQTSVTSPTPSKIPNLLHFEGPVEEAAEKLTISIKDGYLNATNKRKISEKLLGPISNWAQLFDQHGWSQFDKWKKDVEMAVQKKK